jgi:hypothetical protein
VQFCWLCEMNGSWGCSPAGSSGVVCVCVCVFCICAVSITRGAPKIAVRKWASEDMLALGAARRPYRSVMSYIALVLRARLGLMRYPKICRTSFSGVTLAVEQSHDLVGRQSRYRYPETATRALA